MLHIKTVFFLFFFKKRLHRTKKTCKLMLRLVQHFLLHHKSTTESNFFTSNIFSTMNGYQQVRIRKEDKPLLDKLCEKEGLSQVAFLRLLLTYFDETYSIKGYTETVKENGGEKTRSASAEELKKLRDAVISFTRQQEKKILLPMKETVEGIAQRLNEELTQHNKKISKDTKAYPTSKSTHLEQPTKINEKQKGQQISLVVEEVPSKKILLENEGLRKENSKLREQLQLIKNNVSIKKMPMGKTYYVLDSDFVKVNALLRTV